MSKNQKLAKRYGGSEFEVSEDLGDCRVVALFMLNVILDFPFYYAGHHLTLTEAHLATL